MSRGQSLDGLIVRDLDVSKIRASEDVKGFYRVMRRLYEQAKLTSKGLPLLPSATANEQEANTSEETYDFLIETPAPDPSALATSSTMTRFTPSPGEVFDFLDM